MKYIIIVVAFAIWTSSAVYTGYSYCSDREQIKRLKLQVLVLKKKADNLEKAQKAVQEEEEKEKEVVIINRDFEDVAHQAIIASTKDDNPECASADFMRALRNIR